MARVSMIVRWRGRNGYGSSVTPTATARSVAQTVLVMNRLATRSMLAVTRRPSATTPGRVANRLSSSTSSATALVAGAPEPMAMPISASLSASTSLTPSPHPDDAEGRAGAGDRRPLPPGPPPDLLGHPGRRRRRRGGAELAVADRRGPGRCLVRLRRDRRGALLDRAVPRHLPGVQALDQDARAVHLLSGLGRLCAGEDSLAAGCSGRSAAPRTPPIRSARAPGSVPGRARAADLGSCP